MRPLEVRSADAGRDQVPTGVHGAPTDLSDEAVPVVKRGSLGQFALASLTAMSIALCVALALPVLPAMTWAMSLTFLAWPMHRRESAEALRSQVDWLTREVGLDDAFF